MAYLPRSMLQQISLVPTTSLLEWWTKYISRLDIIMVNENNVPTEPTISGNILVIIFLLGGDMSVAMAFIAPVLCMYDYAKLYVTHGYMSFLKSLKNIFTVL